MSKVKTRRLFVDAPPAGTDPWNYAWYAAPITDHVDDAEFLADCDAGRLVPFATTDEPQKIIGLNELPEDDYRFCVIQIEASGNESDPYQNTAWRTVSLDVTPPPIATGGGIEFVNG